MDTCVYTYRVRSRRETNGHRIVILLFACVQEFSLILLQILRFNFAYFPMTQFTFYTFSLSRKNEYIRVSIRVVSTWSHVIVLTDLNSDNWKWNNLYDGECQEQHERKILSKDHETKSELNIHILYLSCSLHLFTLHSCHIVILNIVHGILL